MAIPAGTVLLVTAGGILIYAGFTNQNPLEALRAISSGKPPAIRNESGVNPASFASTGGGAPDSAFVSVAGGGGLASLPQACEKYAGDKYSKAKRNQPGYSDCSSFVGKGLKLIGIKPPPGSTTGSYLLSKDWKRVPSDDVQAGDVAIAANHMVVCYGNGKAIGQQNKERNVQKGTVKELMYGQPSYFYLRYVGGDADEPTNSVMA